MWHCVIEYEKWTSGIINIDSDGILSKIANYSIVGDSIEDIGLHKLMHS